MITRPRPTQKHTIRTAIRLIAAVIGIISASPCHADGINTDTKHPIDRFGLLTSFDFEQDLRAFANHKSGGFRETYMLSAKTGFGALLVTFDELLHLGIRYENELGMGRQSAAILFDPREVNYAIIPFFLYQHGGITCEAGLDHRCYHQVDRKDRPTTYWNQAYAEASSAFVCKIPVRWQAGAGYFVRRMGGMDETLLSGGHPWAFTAEAELGCSFLLQDKWPGLRGRNKITMYSDTVGTAHFAGILGIDADYYKGRHMFGLFINYNYEFPKALPIFSKDRLIELGIRFRY